MQRVPPEKKDEVRGNDLAREQAERGYYYDDAHGYEKFDPDAPDDDEDDEDDEEVRESECGPVPSSDSQ